MSLELINPFLMLTREPAVELDLVNKKLCNLIQSAFPLAARPYQAVGEKLGLTEDKVIERIGDLVRKGVVRQISAIFDTRRLGYLSALVAMRLTPENLDSGAMVINQHPGVSHNYERNHPSYNLWFTLALPPGESLEKTVKDLEKRSGAEVSAILPTIRLFKIGVNFDMVEEEGASYDGARDASAPEVAPLTSFEIQCIRELQENLPLEPDPFKGMAQRLGIDESRLLEVANELIQRKTMRRFGAVLHHRRVGFKYNAMAVWKVPEERAQEVGEIMAGFPFVSHCYQRPSYPDWPYSHFSMVHGTTKEQCEEAVRQLSAATGITDYALLYSSREFKKSRIKYFAQEPHA